MDSHNLSTVLHRPGDRSHRRSWRTLLVGKPLPTEAAPHQTIGKFIGLAVFASDALSSSAYATQEILHILAAAGTAAMANVLPISCAIVVLLAIVALSYEQTIHAYPNGGGSYIVARDNLGWTPAKFAGAALWTDYILTVAVSISSGVAQLTYQFPALQKDRAYIAMALVLVITVVNLRGVKESGAAFAIPTYFFIGMMLSMIAVGAYRYLTGTLPMVVNPPKLEHQGALLAVNGFLLLHAFSSGTAALTGIEAISDGIQAFNQPRSRNAGITLIWMAAILSTLFLSISFFAHKVGAVPSELETVISQVARTIYGDGVLYAMVIWSTTVILVMAANTSFADFPRLSAFLAADGFLPRQLAFRGSRLVYSRGIVTLALLACLLIYAFDASVSALIPLYAIGVFLGFTVSQAGMANRWIKAGRLQPGETVQERGSVLKHEPRWRGKMLINGFGSCLTFVVMCIFAVTKFSSGAWVVLVIIPALVYAFSSINAHYRDMARRLSLAGYCTQPRTRRHRVVAAVSGVHAGSLRALHYARSISSDVTAVHVSLDPDDAERVQRLWDTWGQGVRLLMLESPYRLLLDPLLKYVNDLLSYRQPDETVTIVVPTFVPAKTWHNLLHTQAAFILRMALVFKRGVVDRKSTRLNSSHT